MVAAACLGVGAVCGVTRTGIPLHTIGSSFFLGHRVASSPDAQGEGRQRSYAAGHKIAAAPRLPEEAGGTENFADPPASAAAAAVPGSGRPKLVGGDDNGGGIPLFADFLEVGADGEAAAAAEASAVSAGRGLDAGQAAAGGGAGSHGASPPLVDGRYQDRAKRSGSSSTVASGEGDGSKRSGRWGRGSETHATGKARGGDDSGGVHAQDGEANPSPLRLLYSDEDSGGDGDGDGTCRPLQIEGLDNCPELMLDDGAPSNHTVESLLAIKADILRQVSRRHVIQSGVTAISCVLGYAGPFPQSDLKVLLP